MFKAKIIVHGQDECREVELNPAGTFIGRDETCDLVIDCKDVSRRHARLYGDAAGQWMIEDLNSSNGTFVNGERVKMALITTEDVIEIGSASLALGTLLEPLHGPSAAKPTVIMEDFGTEVFYDKPKLGKCDRRPCPERLGQVEQYLTVIRERSRVYATVVEHLAREPKTAAAVFRLLRDLSSASEAPEVLACCFGSSLDDARADLGSTGYPSHRAFRVSHRLLETVVQENRPLMSKTIFSCDPEVTCSLIDEHSPRALICVPLAMGIETLDLLYVDVPIRERGTPGPEEMFVFVQAVARMVQPKVDDYSWCKGNI